MSSGRDYRDSRELAELYDLVPQYASREDCAFYVQLCRQGGGSVLELGCGTGRVLAEVAAAGIPAVGLDASPHMLDRCHHRLSGMADDVRNRVRLVRSDMTSFDLGEVFRTILIPFRPFQHLVAVDDQLACLRCANRHLGIGGILAFDVFRPNLKVLSAPPRTEETEDVPELQLPDGRRLRRCSRMPRMHPDEQYNEVELIYYVTDGGGVAKRMVHAFPFRYFFRYEVEHVLARTGFAIRDLYGSFDATPFSETSSEMVFVAEKVDDIRAR